MLHKQLPSNPNTDVVILGAGIAGCLSAVKLADSGMRVLLLEKKEDILLGASSITPGRMGLGFHYQHVATAIAYLQSTIEFVKEFPNFAIGRQDPGGYLQRGRYFIVKDTMFTVDDILNTYKEIQKEYKRLVEEDKSNMVFGDPENFYRILDPKEYKDDVNMDIVAVGVETAECLLDWQAFRSALVEKLKSYRNIVILPHSKACTFDYDSADDKYVVGVKEVAKGNVTTTPSYFKIKSEFIVNATWEHVEEVTYKARLNSGLPEDGRTNRLKVLAEVVLPESLKNKNSMFFCMGPHCMFSNMGDGLGLMSYAPNTNVATATGVYIPPKIERFLKERRTDSEEEELREKLKKKQFGEKIIDGVAKYIPAMKNCTLEGLRFGIVKTQGGVDIFDPTSPFHIRNYSGVEGLTLGWVNNSAMKLLYGLNNANLVLNIINEHKAIKDNLPRIVEQFVAEKQCKIVPIQQSAIVSILKKYFLQKEFIPDSLEKSLDKVAKAAMTKSKANELIQEQAFTLKNTH
jgi:SOS response regulatory protein OraA/RecX